MRDALDGIAHARDYWDAVFWLAMAADDEDAIDAAMAEKRALSRLAAQIVYPSPTRGGNA